MKFTEVPYKVLKDFFLNTPGMLSTIGVTDDEVTLYTITSSVISGNGTIDTLGAVQVQEGASENFVFYPDDGNSVDEVFVDSVSVGNPDTYLFTDVHANHTIEVSFTEPT